MTRRLDSSRHRGLEDLLARVLHLGTWAACLVLGCGLILSAVPICTVNTISRDLGMAGVALFILLPIVRVSMMVFVFLEDRDYVFVLISALVLVVIGFGAVLGVEFANHAL
jgi:uncharacterized membrane protein